MAPPKDHAVGDLLISNLFAYFVSKKNVTNLILIWV